jgi:HK97 family phage portal protein
METPIRKALNAVLARGSNTERPPITMGQSGGLLSGNLSSNSGGSQERLNAMGSVGWLFAVIERISTSLAASEWKLYSRRGGELDEIADHPLLDLWNTPNPYYSQSEFIEDSSNHFELTGEMTWVIVRGLGGAIVELWPVRPDRMRPIPDKDDYISGYIYQVGTNEIPLETDDVVFMRRPHPTIPYRGIGQIQSLLPDLGSEQLASAWQRNFFANSALPGGIIELDHNLSTQDFNRLVERWREQHQGVSNSHRVAILERGKWTERKFSQADMQFKETRMLNRDLILGAYGMPHALLGISENVNRANAEAAEVMFSRWLIRPRLIRIRDKLNATLVKQFDPNLYLDFVDPVPADKEKDLVAGERGYLSGLLTKNEARERLGEAAIPEGDDFKVEMPQNPPNVAINNIVPNPTLPDADSGELISGVDGYHSTDQKQTTDFEQLATKRKNDPLLPSPIEYAEDEMQKGWTRRLRHEALALISTMSLNASYDADGEAIIDETIFDGHDWDWEARFGDDVRAELIAAHDAAMKAEGYMESTEPTIRAEIDLDETQQKIEFTEPITHSVAYAHNRAAELLTLGTRLQGPRLIEAEMRRGETIIQTTQRRVRYLVAQTIENREGLQQLASALRSDFMFSRSRSDMIARTETATALGAGAMTAAKTQNRDEKMWITQGDDAVDRSPCRANWAEGWIKISQPFQSGHETIPAHPRCRCNVRYRTAEYVPFEEPIAVENLPAPKTIDLARCEHCNKLLQKNYVGGTLFCHRCKKETTFSI